MYRKTLTHPPRIVDSVLQLILKVRGCVARTRIQNEPCIVVLASRCPFRDRFIVREDHFDWSPSRAGRAGAEAAYDGGRTSFSDSRRGGLR